MPGPAGTRAPTRRGRSRRTWPQRRWSASAGSRAAGRQRQPRHRPQLADLLHRHLHLAARNQFARQAGRDDRGLGVDRLCDAELLDQLAEEPAARAQARVADRVRRKQRLLERLGGADVRPGRAGLHGKAHHRAHQIDGAAAVQDAGLRQLVDALAAEDGDIGQLAALDPRKHRVGGPKIDRDLRPRRPLEASDQPRQSALDGAGGEDLDRLRHFGRALEGILKGFPFCHEMLTLKPEPGGARARTRVERRAELSASVGSRTVGSGQASTTRRRGTPRARARARAGSAGRHVPVACQLG